MVSSYDKNGYYFPVDVFDQHKASEYRAKLESIESSVTQTGESNAIWFTNANFVLPFVDEISRLTTVVDPVKSILGDNLLVWNSSFFIKEPRTPDFVSWHQDLTYWGLSDTKEVTAWIALSPATRQSGCMRFVPGSHTKDIVSHKDTFSETNMLSRGQELAVEVDENDAIDVELKPGQMSLHHGHIFHASHANESRDRRIGLAIRYITPDMKQQYGEKTYAHLVAGEDNLGNFHLLDAPVESMAKQDIANAIRNIEIGEKFFYANAEKAGKSLR